MDKKEIAALIEASVERLVASHKERGMTDKKARSLVGLQLEAVMPLIEKKVASFLADAVTVA